MAARKRQRKSTCAAAVAPEVRSEVEVGDAVHVRNVDELARTVDCVARRIEDAIELLSPVQRYHVLRILARRLVDMTAEIVQPVAYALADEVAATLKAQTPRQTQQELLCHIARRVDDELYDAGNLIHNAHGE